MDLRYLQRMEGRRCEVPESFFLNYSSRKCHISENAWVACQFAKDPAAEQLLAVGDENGSIRFLDVEENAFKCELFADRSCVIDVAFVANRPNNLIAISGHAKVALWDIERQVTLQQFLGHEGSVRALSICDDTPDLFATGARDGAICIWDRREKCTPPPTSLRPYNVLEMTHPLDIANHEIVGMKRKSRSSIPARSKGVTSLLHLDQYTLISASSSFKTGIRFWDLRYRGKTGPFRVLENQDSSAARDYGITSICLDRHNSMLFAASTDSKIYQYTVQGLLNSPVGILQGVKRTTFNTYDFRITASPISDHVMFGGGDCFAVIWDLQEKYRGRPLHTQSYLPYPKYTFGGHRYEVTVARFSRTGRYITTMDDSYLKIWEWNNRESQNYEFLPIIIHQDRVELYELPESAAAEISMKQLRVSASSSACRTPKKNPERSPFKSPFKSPLNRAGGREGSESGCESPAKKIRKTMAPLSPPLCDLTNKSPETSYAARKLDFSETNESKGFVQCAFYYKYPTMNLPDFVKDRLAASKTIPVLQAADKEQTPEQTQPPASPSRPSNCSNMISMEERVERTSPRKIRLNQCLDKPRESARRSSIPKVQAKSQKARRSAQSSSQSTSPTCNQMTTPKQKTLDQYFIKTPRSG